MIIDVFNHFYPKEYLDALPTPPPEQVVWISSTMKGITDLEYRVNQMDKNGVDIQLLSLPNPTLDDLSNVPIQEFRRIMRAGNDGLSKISENSHGRFKAIATVSLLDIGEAIEETGRAVRDLGMLGVQILSNVRGRPLDLAQFDQFYAKINQLSCGLWVHPAYMRNIYDWMNDDYNMNMMMGWGIDTSLAMFRMFRSGVLEKYPALKIIPHHMGTLIPLMAGRINGFVMGQGKNGMPSPLKKSPMEYMKMFYVDTAEGMWKPAMILSHSFFGSAHMLFGTDYPWGDTRGIIQNIKSLDISEEEKNMIFSDNARKILRIN